MASNIFLYWGSGSPPCWRVMMCLEEKGLLGYRSKFCSFEKKEHKSEEVLKINPRGQLPTMKHGDVNINESVAACLYLEDTFKKQGTQLIPDEPKEKALVLQRSFEALNLHKKGIEDYLFYLFRKPEDIDQGEVSKRKTALQDELQIWEGYLTKAGEGSHIATKNFSMADVIFFPSFAFLVRMGMPLTSRPHLNSYYGMMCKRPSVQGSWPPHWKNTPNKDKLSDV